jgi:hypothetical protein
MEMLRDNYSRIFALGGHNMYVLCFALTAVIFSGH